jgi:hypothetical protein
MLTATVALLFLLPAVIRELTRAELVHEAHFYGAWWLLAAWPLAACLTQPWFNGRRRYGRNGIDPLRRWVAGLLFVIPYVSLLLHLRAAYYIDDRVFRLYNLAPVVLGLAAAWVLVRSNRAPGQRAVQLTCLAAAAAVGLSLEFPGSVVAPLLPPDGALISPLRLVLIASALLLAFAWWRRGAWLCLPPAMGLLFASGMGHNVSAMSATLRDLWQRSRGVISAIVPDTMLGWGALAVAGSFVFLMMGAASSLNRLGARVGNGVR